MKKIILSFSLITILILSSCKTDVNKTCYNCNGSGTITEKITCDECKGQMKQRCTNTEKYVARNYVYPIFGAKYKPYENYTCKAGRLRVDDGYDQFSHDGDICDECNGTGFVDCWNCNGYGTISKEKSCYTCGGDGTVKKEVWVWETW